MSDKMNLYSQEIAQTAPLLRLPGEIRDCIHRYATTSSCEMVLRMASTQKKNTAVHRIEPTSPPLGMACHSLRDEVNPIYFEKNLFTLTKRVLVPNGVAAFKRMAGSSASRIGILRLSDQIVHQQTRRVFDLAFRPKFTVSNAQC